MKIKFGSFVVAGSGKIGGHVAAKNRGGAYLRTKVTPLNPNTTAQADSRALLASLSTQWAQLTEAERASWNNGVAQFATTDVFGDLRNPSGINLFVKLNSSLANSNQAQLTSCPTKTEVPFSQVVSIVMDLSSQTVTPTYADAAFDNAFLKCSATPTMSDGVSFVKSQLRVIINNDEWSNDEGQAFGNYVAKYGTPVAGANIYFSVTPTTASGQQGVPQIIKILVQA
jgi:hypothetical protein